MSDKQLNVLIGMAGVVLGLVIWWAVVQLITASKVLGA